MAARHALAVLLLALPSAAVLAADPAPGDPRLRWGFEERLRDESWNNLLDFEDGAADRTHQLRLRSRLWAQIAMGDTRRLRVGLNNESKEVFTPETDFRWDEIIFEELAVEWAPSPAWSTTIGRQNLTKGDGFVLFDGSPLDGSRTQYMNALVAARRWGKRTLELIGIVNPRQEQFLPVLNDRERSLVEWDEEAVGLYYEDRSTQGTSLDAYFLSKSENDDPRAPTDARYQADRRVETLGARLDRTLGGGFKLTAEVALQSGRQDPDRDLGAWGGSAGVKKTWEVAGTPSFLLGFTGLSGDDPHTDRIEGWDPLFSRWPKWSELYIYTLAKERGVAYWTNLRMWQAEAVVRPWKPLGVRATWYGMGAFHPHPGDPAMFGAGRDRGDLFEVRADLTLPKGVKGHVLYERFSPGSFYAGEDAAGFLRFEVTYAFTARPQGTRRSGGPPPTP